MKLLKYISGFILFAFVSCNSEDFSVNGMDQQTFAYIDGDKVIVNFSLDALEMQSTATRGMSESLDYSDMHLYLIEFDDNGSPLTNTYKTVYTPEKETPQEDRVVYKVVLNKSAQPRILHLIALPKSKELSFEYEIEASLIPSLKTDNNTPAYWRRLAFANGYVNINADGNEKPAKELEQLRHVALIRNFACISVTNDPQSNFELTGFAIINNPTSGTIAPWKPSNSSFPEFLKVGTDQPQEFKDISAVYNGISPSGLQLNNQDIGAIVKDDVNPKYVYEREYNSIRHTYVIIKGRRKSVNGGAGDPTDSYYKLDLGKSDDMGVFRYYNILRNYKYNIVLKNVSAKGYESVEKAVQGVVYNNFSFDIKTSSMLNISDGNEVVYVTFTTKVITDPDEQTFDFKYRFRNLAESSPTYNNGDVNFIGLEPGNVIKEVKISEDDDADGWRNVLITCNAAETETKTQSFTIVKESGLGRTINLILHRKWNMTYVKEFPGVLENWNSGTLAEGTAGSKAGAELTIFFDIPDNLSEVMFPMTFTLEADHQNIENNPLGMLVVSYGTSGFNGLKIPGVDNNIEGSRIKYEKTVTWAEYNDKLDEDNPYDNGTAIDNKDGSFTHRVRCRFRTITDLDNFDFDKSVTTVLITNDNFNYATVTFKRDQQ